MTIACYSYFLNSLVSHKSYYKCRSTVQPLLYSLCILCQNAFYCPQGPHFYNLHVEFFAFLFLQYVTCIAFYKLSTTHCG